MADIFVSYTSADRDWAFWIGQELEKLGHTAHIDAWEISAGGNIMAWMEERHQNADHILCVVSKRYLERPFSSLERQAAQWAAAKERPNFVVPVFVESCETPTLLAPFKGCELYGLTADEALTSLKDFMKPAGKPSRPVPFPSRTKPPHPKVGTEFPGKFQALSNIPITIPRYFLGRDEVLRSITHSLVNEKGRVAITTLHGLRGVGKTVLAAAYAGRHCNEYRATWWVRAESVSTIRADLVGLGARLGWISTKEKEEPALAVVMEQLRQNGQGILLIFDNAIDANSIEPYIPIAGEAHVLVTSNSHAWRDLALPLQIHTWSPEIGADYLAYRTGRVDEREAASNLSEALGGLPLALEQAAAYCERLEVSFASYQKRFDESPTSILANAKDAPLAFHNRLTAAKAFTLAIEEAGKLHPAAERLLTYAALLDPGPIPLFLFADGREEFSGSFASAIEGSGLDEAVAALRAFALIDRETIRDERDMSMATDCIRLHRLVRDVSAARKTDDYRIKHQRELLSAMCYVYPNDIRRNPSTWPRARRLDAIAMALVSAEESPNGDSYMQTAQLLDLLGGYRDNALAAYSEAQRLGERALAICEKVCGPEDQNTATFLNNLAATMDSQGNLVGALPLYERALSIREKALGLDHPDTALSLNNLGYLLQLQGDSVGALPLHERAQAINEKALGPDHPTTALGLNNIGFLLKSQGDLAGARPYNERALAIFEKALGSDHLDTARSLNNMGSLLQSQGDLAGARPYFERALAIREKVLGLEHPTTATTLNNISYLLRQQGDLAGALLLCKRALAIREKALGPDHPETAMSFNNLGDLLDAQGDLAAARSYFERALAIVEKVFGPNHPDTKLYAKNTMLTLADLGLQEDAQALRQKFEL